MSRLLFIVFMTLAAVATVVSGVILIQNGSMWVALLPIMISPFMMAIIRLTLEPGFPIVQGRQSVAYLLGDSLALPFAFGAAAMSWRVLATEDGFHQRWWWLVISISVGLLAAYTFHYMDVANYMMVGADDLLTSPTKLWHDYVVYASLGTLLCWGSVPALFKDFSGYGRWVLVGFLAWLGLGVWDSLRGLDPFDLHPRVQDTILR